jgi:predicted TPR repeat methyltransferase
VRPRPSAAPVRPPYSALADVYDEIMQDVPYAHWCDFVRSELTSARVVGRRVLDLGCGTGRAGEPYRDRGFEVVGVDPSEAMIRAARRRDPRQGATSSATPARWRSASASTS